MCFEKVWKSRRFEGAPSSLVCNTAVFSVVTQRSSPLVGRSVAWRHLKWLCSRLPLPQWLNALSKRELSTLEMSGFSYIFNAYLDKLCKTHRIFHFFFYTIDLDVCRIVSLWVPLVREGLNCTSKITLTLLTESGEIHITCDSYLVHALLYTGADEGFFDRGSL